MALYYIAAASGEGPSQSVVNAGSAAIARLDGKESRPHLSSSSGARGVVRGKDRNGGNKQAATQSPKEIERQTPTKVCVVFVVLLSFSWTVVYMLHCVER